MKSNHITIFRIIHKIQYTIVIFTHNTIMMKIQLKQEIAAHCQENSISMARLPLLSLLLFQLVSFSLPCGACRGCSDHPVLWRLLSMAAPPISDFPFLFSFPFPFQFPLILLARYIPSQKSLRALLPKLVPIDPPWLTDYSEIKGFKLLPLLFLYWLSVIS